MNNKLRDTIKYLVYSFIMLVWAFFVAILYAEGRADFYIAPRMSILVKIGATILFLLGSLQAIRAAMLWSPAHKDSDSCCDCHPSTHKNYLSVTLTLACLFIVPVIAGYMMKENVLTSDIAVKKGISYSSARLIDLDLTKYPLEGTQSRFPTNKYLKEYTGLAEFLDEEEVIIVDDALYTETLTTLDIYKEQFVGKKINLRGFVYQDPALDSAKFALLRFSVLCCIADAFPHAVVVDSSDVYVPYNDTWVDLTGTLGIVEVGTEKVLQIHAEDMAVLEDNPDPYVYMNEDFGR